MTGRRVARAIILVATLAALAACGASSLPGYTAAAKAAFLKGCESRTAASTCTCLLSYLQAHVSASKLLAIPAEVRSGNVPSFYTGAISSCTGGGTTTT